MNTNGDAPAYPVQWTERATADDGSIHPVEVSYPGLTKRERIVIAVLVGTMASFNGHTYPETDEERKGIAENCCDLADALLVELGK